VVFFVTVGDVTAATQGNFAILHNTCGTLGGTIRTLIAARQCATVFRPTQEVDERAGGR
jgi:hypothetical protein